MTILRDTCFTSPRTGVEYRIDADGRATVAEPELPAGCECEIDWNCGCGRYGGATWLEVRYDGRGD